MQISPCLIGEDAIGSTPSIARGRATTDPSEPTASQDGNVVPLFPEGLQEDLVPLGGDDDEAGLGHESLASGRAGAWGEGRPAQLLDGPAAGDGFDARLYSSPQMRRGLGVVLWALAGAALATVAIVLTTGSAPTRRPTPPRTTASYATAIATQTSTTPFHRRSNLYSQTHRPASARARSGKKQARGHHTRNAPASQASIVPASYSTTVHQSTSRPAPEQYTPPARTVEPTRTAPETRSAAQASSTIAAQHSAAKRPAFGANGLLGPGSSPDS